MVGHLFKTLGCVSSVLNIRQVVVGLLVFKTWFTCV